VDTIRIDTFLHDEKWVIEKTKQYLNAINNKNISNLTSFDYFYDNPKNNIYLKGVSNE
jgi:hypothetical protein